MPKPKKPKVPPPTDKDDGNDDDVVCLFIEKNVCFLINHFCLGLDFWSEANYDIETKYLGAQHHSATTDYCQEGG